MAKNQENQLMWNGVPVLTTRMLAERLGVQEINIRVNFSENKERYILNQDYFILQGDDLKAFRDLVRKLDLLTEFVSPKTRSIALWTEGGAYNHAKSANTDGAWDAFLYLKKNYFIQKEALKAIKEAQQNPLYLHTTRPVQVQNSKEANKKNFEEGGKDQVVKYNIQLCRLITGHTPKQLKAQAKSIGAKAKDMNSGKDACRFLFPAKAAVMSLTDDFCNHGGKLEEMVKLSLSVEPVFEKMIELGMLNKKSA